jgi:KEOPS complex subunit Cgi121
MLKIIGAKGNIENVDKFLLKVNSFAEKHNILIQTFNAEMIFGKKHLISAYQHAKRAIEQGSNTTNSISMELLLYSSGERQLKIAIPKMGIKKEHTKIIFGIISEKITEKFVNNFLKSLNLSEDDKVLQGDFNTLKKFGLTNKEIKTVKEDKYQDLILEKIAMVDIIK